MAANIFGTPIPTDKAQHHRLDKIRALAVFASDPISSNAYATESVMVILILLGSRSLWMTLPIVIVIAILVALVVTSYNQTIKHYPQGGGAYSVTKDNLGTYPSLFVASALLLEYVLTVSVSVAAGVRAITSALPQYPFLFDHRVLIGILVIIVIMYVNLRGVKESGTIFAVPTYLFVVSVFITLAIGMFRYFGVFGGAPLVPNTSVVPPELNLTGFAFVWLLLRAFSGGCTALTGIEAISNGVTAFKQPEPRNAIQTMRWMVVMAMGLFIGISFLATHLNLIPNERDSILSQLTRSVVGQGPLYYVVQASTMLILVLAANTSYQDFPRMSSFLARDNFMPHWMSSLGPRLVFNSGIYILSTLAAILIVTFKGDEIAMLPLYAIGVFIAFTGSQLGMVRLWSKVGKVRRGETLDTGVTTLHYEENWQWWRLLNLVGGLTTGLVLVVLFVTKFRDGAWIMGIAIPTVMWLFTRVRAHYQATAAKLSVEKVEHPELDNLCVVNLMLLGDLTTDTLRQLKWIHWQRKLGVPCHILHVQLYPDRTERLCAKWHRNVHERWGFCDLDFEVRKSEYRDVVGPARAYMIELQKRYPGCRVCIVVGRIITRSHWTQWLHRDEGDQIAMTLGKEDRVYILEAPTTV